MKQLAFTFTEKALEHLKYNGEAQNYLSDWQFFNSMVTNVELSIEQYEKMFCNLTEVELFAWIEQVKCCYAGTVDEEEANCICSSLDLACFYYRHPITE